MMFLHLAVMYITMSVSFMNDPFSFEDDPASKKVCVKKLNATNRLWQGRAS